MKAKSILTLLIFFLICQTSLAEDQPHFYITPAVQAGFGYTNYILETFVADDQGEIIGKIKSKLEFPLDGFMAGTEFGAFTQKGGKKDWLAEISFYRNINNPGGAMKDHDWITPLGGADFKWSYTESDVESEVIYLRILAGKRIYGWNRSSTYIVGGFRYQKIEQDIINYSGWQYDLENLNQPPVYFNSTIHALYYRTTYSTPMLGFSFNIQTTSRSHLDITTAYMLVLADDYDDHILRYKVSTADGTGHGLYSTFELHYHFGGRLQQFTPFLDLESEFIFLAVSAYQTQKWYDDDPLNEGDETGLVITNIPHDFNSLQLNIGLKVGLYF